MQLSDAVERVIELAEAINDYWATELPRRHPDYPIVHPGEDSGPPPAQEQELRDFLSSLPSETVYRLLLIMYLGRGDFGADELAEQLKYLEETFAKPELAVTQMLEKASLADYLSDGLDQLQKRSIDVDQLPPATAPVGR